MNQKNRTVPNPYIFYGGMFAFFFLAYSLTYTLISVYLLGRGYSPSQVSLAVTTSSILMVIVNPFVGVLQARFGIRKVNYGMFFVTVSGMLILFLASNYLLILLGYGMAMATLCAAQPGLENIGTKAPVAYGRIRVFGTLGASVGMQLSGVLYDNVSPRSMFIAAVAAMVVYIACLAGTAERAEGMYGRVLVKAPA